MALPDAAVAAHKVAVRIERHAGTGTGIAGCDRVRKPEGPLHLVRAVGEQRLLHQRDAARCWNRDRDGEASSCRRIGAVGPELSNDGSSVRFGRDRGDQPYVATGYRECVASTVTIRTTSHGIDGVDLQMRKVG